MSTQDSTNASGSRSEPRDAIPNWVKQELRKEVGYGCPVCRSPFLTWHHFDPPYGERAHNEPKGMIALCGEHHDEADNDNYSIQRLRELKKTKRSAEDVRGTFPSWSQENFLVRLGGSYVGGTQSIISVNNEPIIQLRKNEEDLLAVSFDVFAPDGTVLAKMVDNCLEMNPGHQDLYDFEATSKKRSVSIWFAKGSIGLDLSFVRITVDELDAIIKGDSDRAKKHTNKLLEKFRETLSVEMRDLLSVDRPQSTPLHTSWLDGSGLPDHIREAFGSDDPIRASTLGWAKAKCMDSDGRIPFLNFENMALNYHGTPIRIRNGIRSGGMEIVYCAFFEAGRAAINLACGCSGCLVVAAPQSPAHLSWPAPSQSV